MRDRGPEAVAVLGARDEEPCELRERLLPAAHAADRLHDPVADLEDRLHVEQGAGERLRLADPAAALQVLERRAGEHDPVRASEALDELLDLLVGRPTGEPALDRLREEAQREGHRAGVDDAHVVSAEVGRRPPGRRDRAGQLLGQVERPDSREAAVEQLAVAGEEVVGCGLGRRRKRSGGREAVVERRRDDVDVVAQRDAVEEDV